MPVLKKEIELSDGKKIWVRQASGMQKLKIENKQARVFRSVRHFGLDPTEWTEEQQTEFAENTKVTIRNIRREANEDLKKKLKDKKISEDQNKLFEKTIQKLTDTNIENIEKILTTKEKEIIQI